MSVLAVEAFSCAIQTVAWKKKKDHQGKKPMANRFSNRDNESTSLSSLSTIYFYFSLNFDF